jgi:xanthine/uracil permease
MSLPQVLNQNSFVFLSGLLLTVLALILLFRKARRGWLVWGALAVAAVIGWFALRTTDDLQLSTVADYEATLRAGHPTLIEFYSNY